MLLPASVGPADAWTILPGDRVIMQTPADQPAAYTRYHDGTVLAVTNQQLQVRSHPLRWAFPPSCLRCGASDGVTRTGYCPACNDPEELARETVEWWPRDRTQLLDLIRPQAL